MYRIQRPTRGPLVSLAASALVVAVAAACAAPSASIEAPSTLPGAAPSTSPAAAPAPSSATGRTPVLVDTDLGWDDVSALAYLASRPDIDLRAVTVSGTGEVRCPVGASVARRVLAVVGEAAVPVACGSNDAGSDGTAFPTTWRDAADAGHGLTLPADPDASAPADPIAARDLIRTTVASAAGALRIIQLGPATNLAEAIAADPTLTSAIHDVTVMGGAITAPGNVRGSGVSDENALAEWNVFADPSAWQDVLASGLALTVIPLDATEDVPVTRGMYLALGANRSSPAARLVFDLLDRNPATFGPGESFWDSLASMAAFEPDVVALQPVGLHVELGDASRRGGLVIDPAGATVRAALSAEPDVFRQRFLATLVGGPVMPAAKPATTIEAVFDGTTCHADVAGLMLDAPVELAFEDRSSTDAGVAIARLADGVTLDELVAAAATHPDDVADLARPVISVSAPSGGRSSDVGFAVQPGTYAVACVTFQGDKIGLFPAGSTVLAP